DLAPAVELGTEPEGDCGTGCPVLVPRAEAEVLSVPDRLEVAELTPSDEEGHAGIPEPERREAPKLVGELERARAAGDDGVYDQGRREVVLGELGVGLQSEGGCERFDLVGPNRQAGRGPVPTEALEVLRAGAERRMQVEARDRASRAFPVAVRARDQH